MLGALPARPEEYAATLASGVGEHLETIDEQIAANAVGWSVDRMPAVDRQLLRIATYELVFSELPIAVVIDEAVDLANEYSIEESGRFVNGVLSAIAAAVRPGEPVAT